MTSVLPVGDEYVPCLCCDGYGWIGKNCEHWSGEIKKCLDCQTIRRAVIAERALAAVRAELADAQLLVRDCRAVERSLQTALCKADEHIEALEAAEHNNAIARENEKARDGIGIDVALADALSDDAKERMLAAQPNAAYDWMPEARQAAAQCWCDENTSNITMSVKLAEAVARRIAAWMQTAAMAHRNAEFQRLKATRLREKALGLVNVFKCESDKPVPHNVFLDVLDALKQELGLTR